MPKLFLRNTITNKRYEILSKDAKTNKLMLKGPSGQPFEQPYDKDWLKSNNYELVQE